MPGLMALRAEHPGRSPSRGRASPLLAHDRADGRPDREPGGTGGGCGAGHPATSSPPRITARQSPHPGFRSSPGRGRRWRSTGGAPSSPHLAGHDCPNVLLDEGVTPRCWSSGGGVRGRGAVPDPRGHSAEAKVFLSLLQRSLRGRAALDALRRRGAGGERRRPPGCTASTSCSSGGAPLPRHHENDSAPSPSSTTDAAAGPP